MSNTTLGKLLKPASKITNGILLIGIGILHIQFALSPGGFGNQFATFAKSNFYRICNGLDDLPMVMGKSNSEIFSAFWFFYFGLLVIPVGLLIHAIERQKKALPLSFTTSYFIVVLIGCYMVPNSGMTFLMLPQAAYMLISNLLKVQSLKRETVTR